eukprot:TRINITY_DN12572_c4_g5_i3.p2 TRINITY_DN12572_c4_g5~~TRINITY_DN12572_c4_g5_i3.p2  ORF type:complete len:399 (+),score=119.40 TRINITY_DN12572_c4_g5_i3:3886-5082(+)
MNPSDSSRKLGESLTSMDWLPRVNAKQKPDENGKPPYSYASLITFAINSCKDDVKKMTLAEIYEWIQERYPYFKTAGTGWKNSIRHNLSLNKLFRKIPRDPSDPGKGSYWTIDDDKSNSKPKKAKRKGSSNSSSSKKAKTFDQPDDDLAATMAEYEEETSSPTLSSSLAKSSTTTALMELAVHAAGDDLQLHLETNGVDLTEPGMPTLNNLHAFQGLNDSFSKVYASLDLPPIPLMSSNTNAAAMPSMDEPSLETDIPVPKADNIQVKEDLNRAQLASAQGVVTFDTIEEVLNNVDANPILKASLNSESLEKTQALADQVRTDTSLGQSWLSSSHFPDLAASFANLMEKGNLFASLDLKSLPMHSFRTDMPAPARPSDKHDNDDDDDIDNDFDWNSIM